MTAAAALLLLVFAARAQDLPPEAPFNAKAQPPSQEDLALFSAARYELKADGTLWAPEAAAPVAESDYPFVLRKLEGAQRLKALIQIDMIFQRSDEGKALSPEDRETLRKLLHDNWRYFSLKVRRDFKKFLSPEEVARLQETEKPVTTAPLPPSALPALPEEYAPKPPAVSIAKATETAPAPVSVAALTPQVLQPLGLSKPPPPQPPKPPPPPAEPVKPPPPPVQIAAAPPVEPAKLPPPAPPPANFVATPPAEPVKPPPQAVEPVKPPSPPPSPPPVAEAPKPAPVEAPAALPLPQGWDTKDGFEAFLKDAPYGADIKALLRLISQRAPEFARRSALKVVVSRLPEITIGAGRLGPALRARLLYPPGAVALSPGPLLYEQRSLFFGSNEILLPQSYAAGAPQVQALDKDKMPKSREDGDWGRTESFSDGSARGAYSEGEKAGSLLRELLLLDRALSGEKQGSYQGELFARTAQLMFYAGLRTLNNGDGFLDPDERTAFRQWLRHPREARDHWVHLFFAGRPDAAAPAQADAELAALERKFREGLPNEDK